MKFQGFIVPGGSQEPPAIRAGRGCPGDDGETTMVEVKKVSGHTQYREGLMEKLCAVMEKSPSLSLAQVRSELRAQVDENDVDLLFDNWLNANFDRIKIVPRGSAYSAEVVPFRQARSMTAEERLAERQKRDLIAARIVQDAKENLFQEFSSRIWDMVLPDGTKLCDAKKHNVEFAGGWFSTLASQMKSGEKVSKKFSTQQLFDLSQGAGQ